MTLHTKEDDILRRLKDLEEENARLGQMASKDVRHGLVVTEGQYKGYPTLTFDGSVRQFTLGLTKLRAVYEAIPEIERFLRKHSPDVLQNHYHDDDGVKI